MIVVRALGIAEIHVDSVRILPTSSRKFALLLYLAVEQGTATPRASLCDLIFPDQDRRNAQHSLRELVYQFRQLGISLVSDPHGISLGAGTAEIDVDTVLDGSGVSDSQLEQLARGILPGYAPEHSESFAEWFDGFKARSTFRIARALAVEAARSRAVSDWLRTERCARACLSIDPLNEAATLALAEALAVGGAKNQAVALLDGYNHQVGDRTAELRLAPSILRRRITEQAVTFAPSEGASPFVGRENEMRLLRQELARARRGETRLVSVVGEAGIGKTRLVGEFCRLARLDGLSVASATVQPHDVRRPYAAFADLLQQLMSARGALGISQDSMNLLRRIMRGPSADVTGFSDSLRESDTFSHTIAHAILDLIDAVAAENTIVLSVDDFSNVDPMSQYLFEAIASGPKARRLLLITMARDSVPVSLTRPELFTVMDLRAIDDAAASRFIDIFVDREELTVDPHLADWFKSTAAGHPLFLEHLLVHYASTGERFAIPPSLSSLLRHRIATLSDRADAVLQTCAILGRFATTDTLIAATALSRIDLVRAVNELEAARLLRSDELTIRPTHSLVSDMVIQRMTPVQTRVVRQFCALALEHRLRGDESAALVWEYAEHWYAAGNRPQAVAAMRRCANHALEMGRAESAAQTLARALALADSPDERSELAELLVSVADVAMNAELALEGLGTLKETSRHLGHDDFEFVEFRARTKAYRDNSEQEEFLMRCVKDPEASAEHRVTAAILLLKYADSCLSRELGLRAIAAIPQEVVQAAPDIVRYEFTMIAQVAQRNAEAAVSSAHSLLGAINQEKPREWLHYSLNALLALYQGGEVTKAIDVAESRFNSEVSLSLPQLRLLFATFLWEHSRDMFDDEAAKRHEARIDELWSEFPTLRLLLPSRIAHLCAALTDGDYESGRVIVDRMNSDGLFRGGVIRERWHRIATHRLAQLRGCYEMAESALQALMHSANQGFITAGVCEAEAATACHELLNTGRLGEAREFYRQFVSERRTSSTPVARCLAEVGRSLQA
jgi:DNA-binding SARP family transcriptional activator